MHRKILYLSHLTSPVTQGGGRLADISRQATVYNKRVGINSVLLFDGYRFCQLIEGPSEHSGHLLSRLLADPRHQSLRVLSDSLLKAEELPPAYVALPLVSGYCDALEFDVFEGDYPLSGEAALKQYMQILRRADLRP